MSDNAEHKPGVWPALKETYSEFSDDNVMTWAAATAFYAALSLAPIMTVLAWIAQNTLGPGTIEQVEKALQQVLGQEAAAPLSDILQQNQEQAGGMTIAGIVSILILAFSASGVFAQLQAALNNIWDVEPKPSEGLWGWIRKRILSFGMLITILFLFLLAAVASSVVQGIVGSGEQGGSWWWQVLSIVVSLAIFIPLFAVMFKYLPDVRIQWRDVWVGSVLTALLFVLGKFLLSLYLGNTSYESSYGAAVGSFVALLVWVYYSSIILFVGAEATQVYARREGHPVEPDKHAVRIEPRGSAATA